MNRPEVKIIQNQEENTQPANIASWEAEQLLRKYGYQPEQMSSIAQNQPVEQPGLTFEEMIAQNEAKLKEEDKPFIEDAKLGVINCKNGKELVSKKIIADMLNNIPNTAEARYDSHLRKRQDKYISGIKTSLKYTSTFFNIAASTIYLQYTLIMS